MYREDPPSIEIYSADHIKGRLSGDKGREWRQPESTTCCRGAPCSRYIVSEHCLVPTTNVILWLLVPTVGTQRPDIAIDHGQPQIDTAGKLDQTGPAANRQSESRLLLLAILKFQTNSTLNTFSLAWGWQFRFSYRQYLEGEEDRIG